MEWDVYKLNVKNPEIVYINAILHRYKIKSFKGINFRSIAFLLLLREIFVEGLNFMYFIIKNKKNIPKENELFSKQNVKM